jgi:hypothetical protein
MATVVDSAHMGRLLADAEQLARSITADDERTLAPDRGQNGAARSARAMLDHCSPKQEQLARTNSSSDQDEALAIRRLSDQAIRNL